MTAWRRVAPLDGDDGVGLVSSLAGLFVFLAFLLFAAQILVHLFTTSYVNAAAFDAARLASASGEVSPAAAAEHGRRVLGPFGSRSTFEVLPSAEQVTVRVRGESPALLPRMFGRIFGVDTIDRTVTLRRERPVCDGC